MLPHLCHFVKCFFASNLLNLKFQKRFVKFHKVCYYSSKKIDRRDNYACYLPG